MRYALLVYPGASVEAIRQMSDDEVQSIRDEFMALAQEPGVVGHGQLQPPESATTVRVESGKMLATDGPFADTKEILGGLFLIEADDLDQALDVAARMPVARMGGAIEVRPLVEL